MSGKGREALTMPLSELTVGSSSRLFSLDNLQRSLGIHFKDISLLQTALTHSSSINEQQTTACDNERLEFLGDSVIGLAVADLLYRRFSRQKEGELARMKSVLVSEPVLATIAEELGIPDALLLGRGEEANGGRKKRAIIADAFEAVLGALYLDQGFDNAKQLVERLIAHRISDFVVGSGKDYKTIIQEFTQKRGLSLPIYTLERTEGPDHARRFFVSCTIQNERFGPWEGKTRKEAEQNAARGVFRIFHERDSASARLLDHIAGIHMDPMPPEDLSVIH